jgi:GNAT superfamily N-acetyltransferase
MARARVRRATLRDLEVLVRHRRGMWVDIGDHTGEELDAADRAYRRWARTQMTRGRYAAFIVEGPGGEPVASGCVWIMDSHPRPAWPGTKQAYLLSMYTDPAHRGKGYGTRIVREALRYSRGLGIHRMTLHAAPQGARIYAREGFTRTREMRIMLHPQPRRRARRR